MAIHTDMITTFLVFKRMPTMAYVATHETRSRFYDAHGMTNSDDKHADDILDAVGVTKSQHQWKLYFSTTDRDVREDDLNEDALRYGWKVFKISIEDTAIEALTPPPLKVEPGYQREETARPETRSGFSRPVQSPAQQQKIQSRRLSSIQSLYHAAAKFWRGTLDLSLGSAHAKLRNALAKLRRKQADR